MSTRALLFNGFLLDLISNVTKKDLVGILVLKSLVLYMSCNKFLLAVESRDLTQADKNNIRVSPFPKLCDN